MAEPLDRYHGHRLYPLLIDEMLNNTYHVEHKLGHGGFPTVWMAQDVRDKTYVALKIVVSRSAGDCELAMQEEIVRSVPLRPFVIQGHFYLEHASCCSSRSFVSLARP